MQRILPTVFALLLASIFQALPTRADVAVGDTVFIKPKHTSKGVVILFTGSAPCVSCVQSIRYAEKQLAEAGIPFEVYMADGSESTAYRELTELVTHAKIFDDETGSVIRRYNVTKTPFVLVVAPTGVVQYTGLFATSSFVVEDFNKAVANLNAKAPLVNFRGPAGTQARVIASVPIPPSIVGSKYFGAVEVDSVSGESFIWRLDDSDTAYHLDMAGAIVRRYDMSAMYATNRTGLLQVRHWDNASQRILCTDYDPRRNKFSVFWFDLRTGKTDTVKHSQDLWGRRRGPEFRYHAPSGSCVFGLQAYNGKAGDPNPMATVYVHTATTDTFIGRPSGLYSRTAIPTTHQVVLLGTHPDGWFITQFLSDTIELFRASDYSSTLYHTPIPQKYHVPYEARIAEIIDDPSAARTNATVYSRLVGMFYDGAANHVALMYIVPSSVLSDRTFEPPDDASKIITYYDLTTRKVKAVFEIPNGAVPRIAHNGAIVCALMSDAVPRLLWCVPPDGERPAASASGR